MKNHNSLDSLLQQDGGTNFKGLKKERFAKVFVLLAFSFSKGFFGEFQSSSPQVKLYSSYFSSLFAALKRHPSPLLLLPKDDNSQSSQFLMYRTLAIWEQCERKHSETRRNSGRCVIFMGRGEGAESRVKRAKRGQQKVNKMKDGGKEKYLLYEMGSRCFVRQAGLLDTRVHSIAHVKP